MGFARGRFQRLNAKQQLNALNQILTLSLRLRLCLSLALLMAMSWHASAQMLGVSFEVDTVFGGPSPDFDPDGELEGYTSYLAYANFTNPTDVLGSIYADTAVFTDAAPLQINAPCGCWNPDEVSMVIGPSINPALDPFFPRLKYDSFWTIGKLYETDEGQTPSWTSSPAINGENFCDALVYNGLAYVTGTTGSWPVNAIAGDDLKILIARITSCGEVSLTMNAQVFIEGDQGSVQQFQMCETADLDLDGICDDVDDCVGLYDACGVCNGPGPVEDCGCDDIPAGFCDCEGNQIDAIGICGGTCPADADNDGICDDVDDCVGAYDAIGVCNGSCEEDLNGNGICDDVDFPGCTDGLACNFDPTATFDDESCEYCDCVQPGDYALVVETSPALTLPNHTRYRFYLELANPTDRLREMGGNDEYPLSIDVPMGAYNSTANPVASPSFAPPLYCAFPEITDDSYITIGLSTGANYANTIGSGFENPQIQGEGFTGPIASFFTNDGSTSLNLSEGGPWRGIRLANENATNAGPDASGRVLVMQITTESTGDISGTLNFGILPLGETYAIGQELENRLNLTVSFDGAGVFVASETQETLCGCTDPSAFNFDSDAVYDNGTCLAVFFGCTDPSSCNYTYLANTDDGSCADCDLCGVCAGDGLSCSSCTDPLACNYDEEATLDDGSCEFESCAGCTQEGACNYDEEATIEDDSCEYESCAGCLDSSACNYDEEATISAACDYSCLGCTTAGACNYDEEATIDDGSCEFITCLGCTLELACNYDPEATINDDSCDFSCYGCTDPLACNFNEEATEENFSCNYDCYGCMDEGACNFDAEATLDDGSYCTYDCFGCTDSTACNFDETATLDDGSCILPEQYYDCDGNCINDADGDGVCDELEIEGCTMPRRPQL